MLLISGTPYSNWVLIQMGTTVIDRAMQVLTDEELTQANKTWKKPT